MEFREILGWEAFEREFRPKKNHIVPSNDYNFETYGEELEYIKSLDPRYVWTWIDGDMSSLLVNGVAFVNRINYHVCEVPWDENVDYQVLLSVEVECECYSEDYEHGDYGDPDCQKCEGYGMVTEYVEEEGPEYLGISIEE